MLFCLAKPQLQGFWIFTVSKIVLFNWIRVWFDPFISWKGVALCLAKSSSGKKRRPWNPVANIYLFGRSRAKSSPTALNDEWKRDGRLRKRAASRNTVAPGC